MRDGVADKLVRGNDLSYAADEIIVPTKVKQVLLNAMMATLEDDEEVRLCALYFGQHKDILLILDSTLST